MEGMKHISELIEGARDADIWGTERNVYKG